MNDLRRYKEYLEQERGLKPASVGDGDRGHQIHVCLVGEGGVCERGFHGGGVDSQSTQGRGETVGAVSGGGVV